MDFLWIVGCFECVSSMFCLKLLQILNFTNAVLSKTTFRSIFVSKDVVFGAKEIHRLGTMDLKIYTLERNLQKTVDKVSRLSPKLSLWLPPLGLPGALDVSLRTSPGAAMFVQEGLQHGGAALGALHHRRCQRAPPAAHITICFIYIKLIIMG